MTTTFISMLDDVMPDLNGCSTDMAINALRNTCIELYQKSWIKTATLTPIAVVAGTSSYAITPPTNTRVVGIKEVYFNGTALAPIAGTEATNASHDWTADSGEVAGYMFLDGGTLRLYRIPTIAGVLSATVITVPTKTATEIDTFIYDQYSEAIAAGAKARIMSIPHKPYSDAGTALTYRMQFAAAVKDARWRAYKAGTSSEIQVQLRTRT